MSGERWDEIAQWVDAEGRVGLGALASRFEVSEMTIRRDLDALTAAGRLRRVRGGAVSLSSVQGHDSPTLAPVPAVPAVPAHEPAAPDASTPLSVRPSVPADPSLTDRRASEPASVPEVETTSGPVSDVPSPAFDPSRAPSSLGSVIASWAGAFPAGFPSRDPAPGPTHPDTTHEAPAPPAPPAAAWDDRRPADHPSPPGWDLPREPTRPVIAQTSSPAAPPVAPPTDHSAAHSVARPAPTAAPPAAWSSVVSSAAQLHSQPLTRPSAEPAVAAPAAPPSEDPWARAAHAAFDGLAPGAAVLLTGGTGAAALAHHLARLAAASPAALTAPFTVAVTALAPATALVGVPGVRLVVLGGEAEPAGADLVGPSALAALEDLHLDLAVLTPTGLDARGAWASSSAAAALVGAAVARAERAVAVVAPAALGRPGLVRAAPLAALAQVVAVPAPDEDAAALTARLDAVRASAPSAPRVTAA